MRIFLSVLLFDIIFRSFSALFPYLQWAEELEMARLPLRFPDPEERRELALENDNADPDAVTRRVMRTFDSLRDYWNPWPGASTRNRMAGGEDIARYAFTWLATRLAFLENLVRFEQQWTMFSPNVGTFDQLARARLIHADGSTATFRCPAEPADVLHFDGFRFLAEKRLQYSTKLERDGDARRGFCNLMANRHPRNAAGQPVTKVQLVVVRYAYPEPGADVRATLVKQIVPLGKERNPPFYEYDVATRRGRRLDNR